MKKLLPVGAAFVSVAVSSMVPLAVNAQLSLNPDKFLGNITTYGAVNPPDIEFADLWNQITPENESKWSSIEGSRDNMSWWGCDNCYNYAREHGFPFKFHTLVWGSQYPSWINNLPKYEQYEEIVEWMDAIKTRYPDLDMIDVVNEAIPSHAPAPYKEALGGDGVTGYDWIVKAFDMAYERWPNAILIYNDYNTFQWNTNDFITLVQTIRDAGAPVDAYGCQSHDLTDCSLSTFKSSMTKIQNALQMPMYSTEYDIGTSDDQQQMRQYRDQIKYMWECDYVAGITLWGYIYGKTWTTDGNSGLIRDGQDRPAMTWLRQYMASDVAKQAKGPYVGGKKEASVYIRPSTPVATINQPFDINVNASLATHVIDHIDLYVNNQLEYTLNEAPYVATYTPEKLGKVNLKAIVYDTDGNEYQRLGGFRVINERLPFYGEPIRLPGIIEAEAFDICGDGISYHDVDLRNEGTSAFRTDSEGVDMVAASTGYVIGYTATGEWLEYTVELTENGKFHYDALVSSGMDGSSFKLELRNPESGAKYDLADVDVPNTGDWNKYVHVTGSCKSRLTKGTYILRLTITGAYANIDYVKIAKQAGIEDIESVEAGVYDVFTTTGISLGSIEVENTDGYNAPLREIVPAAGLYLIRNRATGESRLVTTR